MSDDRITQKYGVMWWIRCRLRGIRTKQEGRRLLRRAKERITEMLEWFVTVGVTAALLGAILLIGVPEKKVWRERGRR